MHHMGTELRDSVEQVRRGRSRAHVQIDLVTMQRGLDGGADALLLATDTQIALSRRAKDEHTEILRLGRPQLTDDVVHTRLRITDPRLQGCAFRGSPSFCLLLFSLPRRSAASASDCSALASFAVNADSSFAYPEAFVCRRPPSLPAVSASFSRRSASR